MGRIGKVERGGNLKRNPSPRTQRKIKRAVGLYEEFTGHDATFIDNFDISLPSVAARIGFLDAVMYTTVRDGKTEKYIHEFKKHSRPLLAVSFDGRQLLVIGGSYQFTDRGIEDV